jgi:hypothetical protein
MPKDERTYITVHDGLMEHPKIEALSDKAFRTLLSCWCWCSKNRSDGKISRKSWLKRGTPRARKELVDNGLAVLTDDGAEMHDYLQHQRSAEEIEDLINKRKEAGKKGGEAKARNLANAKASATGQGVANAKANALANGKHPPSKSVPETETDTDTDTDTEQLQEQLLAATSSQRDEPAARKTDPLFDALVEACGVNPAELTTSFRGSVNKALKDLRAVDATPGQVKVRAQRFRKRYESISLTPSALAKHWPALGETNPRPATGFTNHGAGW